MTTGSFPTSCNGRPLSTRPHHRAPCIHRSGIKISRGYQDCPYVEACLDTIGRQLGETAGVHRRRRTNDLKFWALAKAILLTSKRLKRFFGVVGLSVGVFECVDDHFLELLVLWVVLHLVLAFLSTVGESMCVAFGARVTNFSNLRMYRILYRWGNTFGAGDHCEWHCPHFCFWICGSCSNHCSLMMLQARVPPEMIPLVHPRQVLTISCTKNLYTV